MPSRKTSLQICRANSTVYCCSSNLIPSFKPFQILQKEKNIRTVGVPKKRTHVYVHVNLCSFRATSHYYPEVTVKLKLNRSLCVGLICVDNLLLISTAEKQSMSPKAAVSLRLPSAMAYLGGTENILHKEEIKTKTKTDIYILTIRVVHLRVQREALLIAACRRPSTGGAVSSSTCVVKGPGGGRRRCRGGRCRRRRLCLCGLRLLLFEVGWPRRAGLWRAGVLALRQDNVDPILGADHGRPAVTDSLLIGRQGHLDSLDHDGHRLPRHPLVPPMNRGQRNIEALQSSFSGFNNWSFNSPMKGLELWLQKHKQHHQKQDESHGARSGSDYGQSRHS